MSNRIINSLGALSVALFVLSTTSVFAFDSEATLRLDSHDLNSMKIVSGHGFVHVQGIDNGETIEVVGKTVGGSDSRRFTLEKVGDTAVLVAVNTERHFVFEWIGEQPRIDVTVRIPSRLMLEVRDGPGDITIAGMKATATVVDENGELQVNDHYGNLNIYDGAGDIKLQNITGRVYVQDGQGHLRVEKVVGNVEINDGNGSIVVKDIDGHVNIHDGNGGVASANVTQGVTINDGRSGQLAMALAETKD